MESCDTEKKDMKKRWQALSEFLYWQGISLPDEIKT